MQRPYSQRYFPKTLDMNKKYFGGNVFLIISFDNSFAINDPYFYSIFFSASYSSVVFFYNLVNLFTDFEYVVNRPIQPKLCFGSHQARVTLPMDPKDMNSFMRRIAPTTYKNVGPGSHDNNRGAFYDLVSRVSNKPIRYSLHAHFVMT